MDWRPTVLKKYWEGESSLAEEGELRSHTDPDDEDAAYFKQLRDFDQLKLPAGFTEELMAELEKSEGTRVRPLVRKLWKYAAAAVLFLGVGLTVFRQAEMVPVGKTIVYDDPAEALEFTKQTLLLFSTKMNEGMSYTYSLQEFDGTIEKVRNNK